MNAIVIVDQNWGIGCTGRLLAHLPGDLRHFREKTEGNTIIIGRETFESMGSRLLLDRETVILSRNTKLNPGCKVVHSLEELLRHIKGRDSDAVFAAGGEEVYKRLKENGILIRHFSAPRTAPFVRVTVGTKSDMERFVTEFNKL